MIDNESLPPMDDIQDQGQTEQELLDAVMKNSPIMDEVDIPLPEEEVSEVDPVESDEEVEDPESEEVVSEETEEEVEESEEEEVEGDAAEAATEVDVYTADDLDLDAKLAVKIDGEELEVSFGDLIKGYTTEQSLSKKGRELGEARKALDEERAAKLGELESIVDASVSMIAQQENAFSKQYHAIEAQIEKARADGDTYEVNELKDRREQAQKNYWAARNRREQVVKEAEQQRMRQQEEAFNAEIANFQEVIPNLIPDFNEEVAMKIRDFAIENGIDEELLSSVTSPEIVKFIDDYRRLKQGVSKGVAKRKAAPVKKVPAKKAASPKKKAADKANMTKARAFREDASPEDHMAFLKQHASKSLKL